MSYISVIRIDQTENSTVSKLYVENDFLCFVIEDGERQNKIPGLTRIPGGKFRLVKRKFGRFYDKYQRRFRHEFVWEVANVPGFTDILIHIGNGSIDTRGCLLVNQAMSFDGLNYYGINSTSAYRKLYKALKNDIDHVIHIIR